MTHSINPIWIVENYAKEQSFIELIDAIRSSGSKLIEIKDDYSKSILANRDRDERVILNGSIAMLNIIREDLPFACNDVLFPTLQNYSCSKYYTQYGDLLFNDRYMLMTLSELGRQRWMVYEVLGKEGIVFVRPDSGEKPYQAQLLDIQDLDEFLRMNEKELHSLCLVSSPKNIWWEGRFVCYQQEIIAKSTYKMQGMLTNMPSVPKEAEECCRKVLQVEWRPDPVFVVDICGVPDGKEYYLLELNAFASSGLYECNKGRIVERLNEIVLTSLP